MGKQYKTLTDKDIEFIKEQKLFYIASSSGSEINLSPKGYDSIRVLSDTKLLFMNYPGSGNRTYRDAEADGKFTIVFNAFMGAPKILRLFCKAVVVELNDEKFDEYAKIFKQDKNIIRDFFVLEVYAIESSCGMSVPIMEYKEDREQLRDWAIGMNKNRQLEAYKEKHFVPVDLENI